ncbi:hypothetical protein [Flavobacterium sp. CS20]|jgi:hypothetical protein|uniref:hypothetical protein n=1 Tax=Flavobacterium sp. CS20 TaxID=2775246 RepID=UPI001B39FC25|nr:hypothetical protein [Flavobacterium sp. CS20]QTY27899.1 hypothetical protein IGB25_05165 [Flavobacterium sp. CS20]
METKTKKEFDAVKFAREQKDKLSEVLSKMSKEEIVAYFKKIRLESRIKPSA